MFVVVATLCLSSREILNVLTEYREIKGVFILNFFWLYFVYILLSVETAILNEESQCTRHFFT